jgi:hypothetical protein
MHAFMLILAIAGQPERAGMICETYKECSDEGAELQTLYVAQFHKQPRDYSYRVVPVLIMQVGPTS